MKNQKKKYVSPQSVPLPAGCFAGRLCCVRHLRQRLLPRRPDRQRQQSGDCQYLARGFLRRARDADVLLYNSTIEGELRTMDELLAKCPMLADFKAVQSGSVWCTSQSLFQQSMELPELILDMNRVFTEDDPDDSELTFLTKLH